MAAAEDEWGGDLTRFLDRLPSRPCLVPPPPSFCSVCGKLNNPVASLCRYYPLRFERARGDTRIGPYTTTTLDFEVVPGEDEFPDAPLIEYERPGRPAGVITMAPAGAAPRLGVKKIPHTRGVAAPVSRATRARRPARTPRPPTRKAVKPPSPEVFEAEVVEIVEEPPKKPAEEVPEKGAEVERRERLAEKKSEVPAGTEKEKRTEDAEQRAALEEAERLEREFIAAGKIRPLDEAPTPPPTPKEPRIPTIAPIYKEPILKILSAEPPKPSVGAPTARGAAPMKETSLPPPPPGFHAAPAAAPAPTPPTLPPSTPVAAPAATPPSPPPQPTIASSPQPQPSPPPGPPPSPQPPTPATSPAQPAPSSTTPPPVPATGRRTGGLYDILRKKGTEEKKEAPTPPSQPATTESGGTGKTEKDEEFLKKLKEISK
ncbi:MAG: hypothetical protein QW379_07425 [Thermoplasmata archaeon]